MTIHSPAPSADAEQAPRRKRTRIFPDLFLGDPLAVFAAIVLTAIILLAIFGPMLVDQGGAPNFRMRNAAPFSLAKGAWYLLGSDTLGRPIIGRLIAATQLTLVISFASTILACLFGAALGILAGYRGGWIETLIMRIVDSIMSFPSLLMAVIVLFVFQPRPEYIVAVLAITRIPVYTRVARAEVMTIRESVFIEAARVIGAPGGHIVRRHILPLLVPPLLTVMTIDFAVVMLAESSLSFLGIGVQPPAATWGLMVANGRNYLGTAWWISFFPGVMIILTALCANLLANWLRLAMDPRQHWRLKKMGAAKNA